jgi:hypothetical protein
VIGNYSCGKVEVWYPSQPGQFKKWPSFSPDCVVKEVLPLPKKEVDVTDRLDWMSGFIFGTLRTGLVVTLVFFSGCGGDIVVCCEKMAEEEALAECREQGERTKR